MDEFRSERGAYDIAEREQDYRLVSGRGTEQDITL